MTESLKQSAMLGTSRKAFQESDLPLPLQAYTKHIIATATDPEDAFLQTLATTLLYNKSGQQAIALNNQHVEICAPELQSYISKEALALLSAVIETEDNYYLGLWLTKAKQSAHILTPEWIPTLFELTEKHPILFQETIACSGERGKWLARFNSAWKVNEAPDETNLWAHGSSEERKKELLRVRLSNPEEGLTLLKDVWAKENASTRMFLLQVIEDTLHASDEEWLISIQKDKSQKVKDKSYELQSRLPHSKLVELYSNTLKEVFSIKKGKSLLGLLNTSQIEITELKNPNPLLWESGIEKLSNIKGMDDKSFFVMELLRRIPPATLEALYALTPKEILTIIQNDVTGKNLIGSITHSITAFKDVRWAEQFVEQFPDAEMNMLIPILPESLRLNYFMKHLKSDPSMIIPTIEANLREWPLELSTQLFTFTSKNPYSYTKTFYVRCLKQLPIQTLAILPAIKVEESIEHLWNKHRSMMMHQLQLKKDIQETIF